MSASQCLILTTFFAVAISSCAAQEKPQQLVTTLSSDGPNRGKTAYELIRDFGGPRPIESPDLYAENHPGKPHIFERHDDVVGNHFVFVIHKNEDKDRDKYKKFNDRQRNEIKAYSKSREQLKGYEGESLHYSWKFKVGEGMSISKNFTHLFQLKSVDDGIGTPILTLSGARRKAGDLFVISHSPIKKAQFLDTAAWDSIDGKWLEATCSVTYGNNGRLSLTVKELDTGLEVLSYASEDIDMWRGTKPEHFVRPKWGIYRSLKSKDMLRDDEEEVSFADFSVIKAL